MARYKGEPNTKEWAFKLEHIKFSRPLVLWFGTEDKSATIHMGRCMAETVPGAELREVERESHFTTGKNIVHYMYLNKTLNLGEI